MIVPPITNILIVAANSLFLTLQLYSVSEIGGGGGYTYQELTHVSANVSSFFVKEIY